MLTRIVLDNFMSHSHTVIDLSGGLNVLVGPNNCGKSAVVEALRTLCENDNADHLIKHGENSCRITVHTDDGHIVAWCRKGATVWYEFDGEPQDRVRGKVPPRVNELLRLGLVQTPQDEPVNVHMGLQKTPIFILNDDAADRKAAAFFSSTSDAQHLLEMQQLHRSKRTSAKSRLKELARELEDKQRLLEALLPLADLEPKISQIESEYESIQNASAQRIHLQRLIDSLASAQLRQSLESNLVTHLRALQPLPQQQDAVALARLVEQIESQSQAAARAQSIRYLLAELKEIPRQSDLQELLDLVNESETAIIASQRAQSVHEAMAKLKEPPQLTDPAKLQTFIERCTEARQRASNFAVDVVHLSGALDDLKKEAQAFAGKNPSCPVCGGVIDGSVVLSEEHAHA